MTNNKGSKIALAVAGLLLIAGAAAAIAMTRDKADAPKDGMMPLTNNSAPQGETDNPPAAESGEAPMPNAPDDTGKAPGGMTNTPMSPDSGDARTDEGSAPVPLTPPAEGKTDDDSTLMKTE
tara:strand:+ start:645 stop:1010 length:366 start_codon:yes stop_codon:yes gene_type:complete